MSITLSTKLKEGTRDRIGILSIVIGILIGFLSYPTDSVPATESEYDTVDEQEPSFITSPAYCTETRQEWARISDLGDMHITCYGPDRNGVGGFPLSGHVSRWIGRSRDETGFTVQDALSWADELGLDGICASSPGSSGLYSRHRDESPPVIEIEGHGKYLVVDRMASYLWNRLDIWVPDPWPGGTLFSEQCHVWEIELQQCEYEVDTYGYW